MMSSGSASASNARFRSVIGVDCATRPERTGLAVARRAEEGWRVTEIVDPARENDPAEIVTCWLNEGGPTLIALDAPLGWPAPLGRALTHHRPGDVIAGKPDHLFARETDRHVYATLGKKPLDVGADRIARTAVAALGLLNEVRRRSGVASPLWWAESPPASGAAVEVYPAGTLRACGVTAKGYKKNAHGAGRGEVASLLANHMRLPDAFDPTAHGDDAIDALLCVLAGIDVVEGRAVSPRPDQARSARAEGWIWIRRPEPDASPA